MLNITSKRFFKAPSSDSEGSPISGRVEQKAHSSSLAYTGNTFVPKSTGFASQMSTKGQIQLVSGRHSSAQSFSNFGLGLKEAQLSYGSDSELSATTEASSENSTGCPITTRATNFGAQVPKCALETVRAATLNQTQATPATQNWGATLPQGVVAPQNLGINGSLEKSIALNGETTQDQNTTKKKTRRGGKKARLRRERQKEKEAKEGSDSNTEASPSSSEKEVKKSQVKYKTELCKNWIETGRCRYSVRCMFAHGHHELVQASKPEVAKVNYKTKPCEKYHNEFYCSYGIRCIYSHEERSLSDLQNSYYGKNLLLLADRVSSEAAQSKRLRVFEDLTTSGETPQEFVGKVSDEVDLPSVCLKPKAPIENSQSFSSDSTENSELAVEELRSSVELSA